MVKEVKGNKVSKHLIKKNALETDSLIKNILQLEGLNFTESDIKNMKLVSEENCTTIFLDSELEALDLNLSGKLLKHFHEKLNMKPAEVSEWSDKFKVLYDLSFEKASVVLFVRKPFMS